MKTVKLHNGVEMPMFGLGTFRINDHESALQVVKKALEIGYRHIDTAQMYKNEAAVGDAISNSGIARKDIFITTKLASAFQGDEVKIKDALESSLKALKTDYIDLVLIHWPNHDEAINAKTWRILEAFYNAGKFRAIGVSNFQKHHIESLLKTAQVKPMVNQVEMHPGLSQVPLQRFLKTHNIALISYGPLMKGHVFEAPFIDVLSEIGKTYHATVAQVVIAWGLARGILMIPKSANENRLLENYQGQEIVLSQPDLLKIDKLNRGTRVYTDPDNNPF